MGSGHFDRSSFISYSTAKGSTYDYTTNKAYGQVYTATKLNEDLNPKNVIRECVNTDEHPNTIPVILALDVTGSMGDACKETAESLGVIMIDLYKKYKDIEIMIMGIGDIIYDSAPIQVSQFESDIRIAEWLDKIWMEHGGGPNRYESYSAAWYFGLYNTKLDCYDKQGRKGIIITMGDEPLNPMLDARYLSKFMGTSIQSDVITSDLYEEASKKFDIYHIAVNDSHDAYKHYVKDIKESFGKLLNQNLIVSTIDNLSTSICDCIDKSIKNNSNMIVFPNTDNSTVLNPLNENEISNEEISW